MSGSLIFGIVVVGFAAGLRTMTPPAVIAWAAYLGCLDLSSTPLAFMSSPLAVGILSLSALGEYVADLLPGTPARTAAPGLIARIVTGSFAAACLLAAGGQSLILCPIGGLAAIGGAFAGFRVRTGLVRKLGTKDAVVAIPEDLVAIGLAVAAVCLR